MTVSGKIIPYRFHYLLQIGDVIDSVATLTTDVSVFGPLSVGDESLGMGAAVRIKVAILSRFEAHHIEFYVSLYWTSGGDPSSRLVQGFLLTANMSG
jgi:hypothetical protein